MVKSVFKCVLFSSMCMSVLLVNAGQPIKKEKKAMNESKKAMVSKIGVVDIRRVLSQNPATLNEASHEWKDLFNKLQETLKEPHKEFAEIEEKYKKKGTELESLHKSGISSQEALRKKYQEEVAPLEERLRMLDQQLQRFTYDELTKAQNIVGPKLEKAIDQVVAAQGWDFVITRDSVASKTFSKQYEVTDDVLQILNKQYAEDKAKEQKKN